MLIDPKEVSDMNRRYMLGIYTAVYAIFYSFCLYKNLGGATFPFFVIGTLCYIMLCTKEFGLTWKKDSIFAVVAVTLIGISQMLTGNTFIRIVNVLLVFLLLTYIILHQFSYDEKWHILRHFANILSTFFAGIYNIYAPVSDFMKYKNNKNAEGENKKSFPWYIIVITAVVCIPFLFIVIAMLSSADVVFANMWKKILDAIIIEGTWYKPVILSIFVFFFTYGIVAKLLKFPYSGEASVIKKYNPLIAMTAGVMFGSVYLIFSVIQIFYLFIGNFSLPNGYSYAQYAREGFFELLFVCALNLCMVLVGIILFDDNKKLKVILSVICGCTYIMTASSAFRMILYIRYYYFSFLRILVLWTLFVIFLLLTGLTIQIWKKDFKLFKYGIIVCSVCYIALAFSHIDAQITRWNLANSEKSNEFFLAPNTYDDYKYLHELSSDAIPALVKSRILTNSEIVYFQEIYEDKEINLRNFNLSIYLAKKSLKEANFKSE